MLKHPVVLILLVQPDVVMELHTQRIHSEPLEITKEILGLRIHSARLEAVTVQHTQQIRSEPLEITKGIHGLRIHSVQLEEAMEQLVIRTRLAQPVVIKYITSCSSGLPKASLLLRKDSKRTATFVNS